MAIARSTREVFDYVPRRDRQLPTDKQTVFQLRRFPTWLMLMVQNLGDERRGEIGVLAIRHGILGWKNFVDDSGAIVPCEHDKGLRQVSGCEVPDPLSIDCLNRLPMDLTGELLEVILLGSTVTQEDAKN